MRVVAEKDAKMMEVEIKEISEKFHLQQYNLVLYVSWTYYS